MWTSEALSILDQHSPKSETWPRHCRQVARIARTVADALVEKGVDLDSEIDSWWNSSTDSVVIAATTPDTVEAWAYVHDIGRSRDHGPLHGWIGYELLRELGRPELGRGCLTHWIKGRSLTELRASAVPESVIEQLPTALAPQHWRLADSILSFADSSVAGVAIVPLATRHADLRARYGGSTWMDRHEQLGEAHQNQISSALGHSVAELLAPLYDSEPDHA